MYELKLKMKKKKYHTHLQLIPKNAKHFRRANRDMSRSAMRLSKMW